MFINISRFAFIPSVSLLIVISSYILGKTTNLPFLIISACLFSGSVVFYKKIPFAHYVQLGFLAIFHFSSHLNWSQLLYIILIVITLDKRPKMTRTFAVSFGYSFVYTAIRLTYEPIKQYTLLVSLYDFITFMLIAIFMMYLYTSEIEKRRLQKRNQFLTTHDPLTKLLNYEGYIIAVNAFIHKKKSDFAIVLLDFQDFKSVNTPSINEILIEISSLLQTFFPAASAISRYAGDRFALAIPLKETTVDDVRALLDSNRFRFEVTFSMAMFPNEAASTPELIALAEDRLFQNKRKLWMQREEEMFRSEKMKIVGELAAGMAHEIRNPLTTMQGFMQLSKSQSYNIEPWYDIIMNEITRMNELTAEFLQFSKPHIGNMKPDSISKCIERVSFLTESQAVSRGHNISVSNVDESVLVLMDRDKVVQVLLNLTRNAVEAMKDAGTISIWAKQINSEVVIEVEDTGIGIQASELEMIFNPFYTTKETGTGLGLSICYKIIQDHGGTLTVNSTIGKGSIFTIKLPTVDKSDSGVK